MNIKRRFIIGDIHGCLDELKTLLGSFKYQQASDQVISVGDIIGKGPQPLKTLQYLFHLKAKIVCGNHDRAVLDYSKINPKHLQPHQSAYLESLGNVREHWLEYIASWPNYLEWEDIVVVHAGLEPGKTELGDMNPHFLRNIRTWNEKSGTLGLENHRPWFELVQPTKIIVFGHWAKKGLINLPHFKGLDTGCVYGKKLTGYCPEEDKIYQVEAKQVYKPIIQ